MQVRTKARCVKEPLGGLPFCFSFLTFGSSFLVLTLLLGYKLLLPETLSLYHPLLASLPECLALGYLEFESLPPL